MKKIFALMTAVSLALFAYTSCSDDDDAPEKNDAPENIETPENTVTPENTENPVVKDVEVFADFMVAPTRQFEPSRDVNIFTNKVDAENVRYLWDFGDGTNAVWQDNSVYQEKLVHTYKTSGEYTITLIVTDKDGKIETARQSVSILPESKTAANPSFVEEIVSGSSHFIVTPSVQIQPSMNVNIYCDPIEAEHVTYTWDFGDGSGSYWRDNSEVLSTLVHTYDTWGVYTITLLGKVLTDKGTEYYTSSETIKILPAPPTMIQTPTKYEGVAPYTMVLEPGVMYYDFLKWDIRSVKDEKETTPVAMFYEKADKNSIFTFDKPGDYLLYLTAYGNGAPDGKYIRTDTLHVVSGM